MNQMYGFEGEVKAKYTAQMFQLFSEVFQWLPLAQCINSKVLVSSHGGGVFLQQDGSAIFKGGRDEGEKKTRMRIRVQIFSSAVKI